MALITRPRCFGKTLNMSMMEQFFSIDYAGRSDRVKGYWEEMSDFMRNRQNAAMILEFKCGIWSRAEKMVDRL